MPLRQRAQVKGRAERRPRGHLHAHDTRAAHRHARLHEDRRRAQRRGEFYTLLYIVREKILVR